MAVGPALNSVLPQEAASEGEAFFEAACHAFAQTDSHRRTLAVAGMRIDLRIAAGDQSAAMARYLSALVATPDSTGGAADLTVMIWDADATGIAPPAPDWQDSDHVARGELPRFSDGRFLFCYNMQSRVLSAIDTERRLAIQCIRSLDALPQYEWGAPLRDILSWRFSAEKLPMLHASAIAAFGHGALLVGPGGSGKSTTAALCLGDDTLAFVADDYAAVALATPVPQLRAVFGTSKLTPAALAGMPSLDGNDFSPETGKALVRLRPDQIASDLPLRSILLPRVTGEARSEIVPAGQGEALRQLAPSTLFQLPASGARELAHMAELVRRVPAFRLNLGHDRTQLRGLLTDHLRVTG